MNKLTHISSSLFNWKSVSLNRILISLTMLFCSVASALAVGWPYAFEGVMLQGFWWDSYQTETKWRLLEERSDELARSFKVIWVPNSGRSSGGLGYIPIYWFTNHNSDMGTEAELRSMIKTFKAKDTDMMMDLVINHRGGATNWTDFPTERWDGQDWHIGLDGICSTDEVNRPGNPGGATGAPDEADDFDGARDLDHTNANVQANCKAYMRCLLEDFGYAGFRLDMVKGYKGYYTNMYNTYAKPKYSVGEYWDGQYDALAAWIESTGCESAAFDFAFKYAVNEAFASGDLRKLVWKENGVTPKPAGLIHHWYQQLAVTFIDNHDTFRDDWNQFHGNWAAANAFMICSPGTPCVFMPHWNACGDQIARMINARNSAGVTNTSDVRVLKSESDCYMAELDGANGKLVVKIGSSWASPSGYQDSQIFCYGEDYCIWTTTGLNSSDFEKMTAPDELYVIGNLPTGSWKTNDGVKLEKQGNKFTGRRVKLSALGSDGLAYFSFATKLASKENDWNTVNGSNRFGSNQKDRYVNDGVATPVVRYRASSGASGSSKAWVIPEGRYDITLDFDKMLLTMVRDNSTGIDDIEAEGCGDGAIVATEVQWYNLQGQRVANPTKGIYIKVQGAKAEKVSL